LQQSCGSKPADALWENTSFVVMNEATRVTQMCACVCRT
jgi:hypothetical protein